MKSLSNIFLAFLFIILINGGCKKSDVVVDEYKLTGVKMYDDTFAGGEKTNVTICAGRDRLYMTYGYGTGVNTTINGINFFDPSGLQQTLMSTDLNGEFIWRLYITPSYSTSTPIELNDGTCLVAVAKLVDYTATAGYNSIYFLNFDRNGEQISSNYMSLPPPLIADYTVMTMDLIKDYDDNVIVYGTASDYVNSTQNRGYIAKFNIHTGLQWCKYFQLRGDSVPGSWNSTCLYNCTKTSDGGFIFLGSYYDGVLGDPRYNKAVLVKTDANCDTVWTKWYDHFETFQPTDAPIPGNVIQMDNGNYRFCTNDIIDGDRKRLKALIYEVNANGDYINNHELVDATNKYCPVIIKHNESNLAIINEYPTYLSSTYFPIFNQINSWKYRFDRSLNLIDESPIQTERSDFITAGCNLPDGRIALFGLFGTANNRSYSPGLLFIK